MRFKAVPPAPTTSTSGETPGEGPTATGETPEAPGTARERFEIAREALDTVRDALPLVPRSEDDCCARLVDRVEWIDQRDVASEWIVLLRALGLTERSDAGYTRVRSDLDPGELATRFREGIVGAEAAIAVLDDEPRTADAVFEAIRTAVPEWERRRSDTWTAEWRVHTRRVLDWATLLGLATRTGDGYVAATLGGDDVVR